MARAATLTKTPSGVSVQVLALRYEFMQGAMRPVAKLALAGREVELLEGRDALWAVVRRAGKGALAVRVAHLPGDAAKLRKVRADTGEICRIDLEGPMDAPTVRLRVAGAELPLLRITTTPTPAAPLLIPFLPRDLHPLSEDDNPIGAVGRVEAAQRGLNTGLTYFHLDNPAFGSVLCVQNFTALVARRGYRRRRSLYSDVARRAVVHQLTVAPRMQDKK